MVLTVYYGFLYSCDFEFRGKWGSRALNSGKAHAALDLSEAPFRDHYPSPLPPPRPACLLWDAWPVHPPDAALRIIHNMPPSGWTTNPLHKTPESACGRAGKHGDLLQALVGAQEGWEASEGALQRWPPGCCYSGTGEGTAAADLGRQGRRGQGPVACC